MGIFSKFSTLLKSNINDLIARAENPEKMLNQIILDMRDQLAKAKREVAAAIADERKLRAQLDDEIKQTRDWEHRAMLAVKEGRDDLAKQALIRQQEHAQRAATLEQTWGAQAQETEKLKGSLRQLNDKTTRPCPGSPTRLPSKRSTAWRKRSRNRNGGVWPKQRWRKPSPGTRSSRISFAWRLEAATPTWTTVSSLSRPKWASSLRQQRRSPRL